LKILIQGYYGFGNLGDDLLLTAAFLLVKNAFPEARIHILSNNPASNYIYSLTDNNILIKDYKTADEHYDIIVHGGGGIHFDFSSGSFKYLIRNTLFKIIGINLSIRFMKTCKHVLNIKHINCNHRIGLGIGFGSYTMSSKKYSYDMSIIRDYDHLFIRDPDSLNIFRKFRMSAKIYDSSDLIFTLLDHPYFSSSKKKKTTSRNKIGIILRDWPYDNNFHINQFLNHIKHMEKIYDFTFLSFDNNDSYLIDKVKEIEVYNPSKTGISRVLKLLSKQDLLITSRAHGAFLGCIMKVPTLCVNIEPKLRNVHKSLLNSTLLIPADVSESDLEKIINSVFLNYAEFLEGAILDYKINLKKAEKILNFFEEYPDEFTAEK